MSQAAGKPCPMCSATSALIGYALVLPRADRTRLAACSRFLHPLVFRSICWAPANAVRGDVTGQRLGEF